MKRDYADEMDLEFVRLCRDMILPRLVKMKENEMAHKEWLLTQYSKQGNIYKLKRFIERSTASIMELEISIQEYSDFVSQFNLNTTSNDR
jgi:hypothetical protein